MKERRDWRVSRKGRKKNAKHTEVNYKGYNRLLYNLVIILLWVAKFNLTTRVKSHAVSFAVFLVLSPMPTSKAGTEMSSSSSSQ
jgi:hypothetical protein